MSARLVPAAVPRDGEVMTDLSDVSTFDLIHRCFALTEEKIQPNLIFGRLHQLLEERDAIEAEIIRRADDMSREMGRLLQNARCDLNDPGLSRSWGRKRRAYVNDLIDRGLLS